MKIEITKAQLKAIQDGIDTLSSIGADSFDPDLRAEVVRALKAWDQMLKKNNLPPRDFN